MTSENTDKTAAAKPAAAAKVAAATAAERPKAPKRTTVLVLDTTAKSGLPPREHQQIIEGMEKTFRFEHGKGTELPIAVAAKFLRHPEFKLVDDKGQLLTYQRKPAQPEELGAGETLKLGKDQTVAFYDELSTRALFQRALELKGGERFAASSDKPDRAEMVAFIQETTEAIRKANTKSDATADSFTPEADGDEDGLAEDAA